MIKRYLIEMNGFRINCIQRLASRIYLFFFSFVSLFVLISLWMDLWWCSKCTRKCFFCYLHGYQWTGTIHTHSIPKSIAKLDFEKKVLLIWEKKNRRLSVKLVCFCVLDHPRADLAVFTVSTPYILTVCKNPSNKVH